MLNGRSLPFINDHNLFKLFSRHLSAEGFGRLIGTCRDARIAFYKSTLNEPVELLRLMSILTPRQLACFIKNYDSILVSKYEPLSTSSIAGLMCHVLFAAIPVTINNVEMKELIKYMQIYQRSQLLTLTAKLISAIAALTKSDDHLDQLNSVYDEIAALIDQYSLEDAHEIRKYFLFTIFRSIQKVNKSLVNEIDLFEKRYISGNCYEILSATLVHILFSNHIADNNIVTNYDSQQHGGLSSYQNAINDEMENTKLHLQSLQSAYSTRK